MRRAPASIAVSASGHYPLWPRSVRSRDGFTIIEVLVAALVLTIGIVSLLASFSSSQKLGTSAEAHQTAVGLAEGELERLRGLKWTTIALSAEPTRSSETGNPTHYEVSPTTAKCAGNGPTEERCFEWNWSETAISEPLVVESGGAITEDPRTVNITVTTATGAPTRMTFYLYSFVTWANDSGCATSICKGNEDSKRVLVAVTGSHLNKPVSVLSLINDREPKENPLKGRRCEEESGTQVECVYQK